MAETTTKDAEESPIRGFSVVDSLTTSVGTQGISEEVKTESIVLKLDDTVPANAEVSGKDGGNSNDDTIAIVLNESDCRDKEPNQSTLIITTEDLLDSTTFDDTLKTSEVVEVKEEKKPVPVEPPVEDQKKIVKPKPKREDHSYFWVSNISRQVKAADLKKFFSQIGKVSTAKILTNGRNYFGYVSMGSGDLAARCIKQLNNATFDNKKITVSKDRPDLREPKVEPKKKKVEPKKEEVVDQKATKPSTTSAEVKSKKIDEDHHAKCNSTIGDLKRKLDRAKDDVNKYKFKVLEFQCRHEGMRKKCEALERELFKLRNDRRRLNQDREQFEKNRKLEQIRFDADRAIINKELDEVKKLREHLKEKIEEFKVQTKKIVSQRRSRSPPVVRGRNIRARSPPLRSNSNHVFRPEDRGDKKRKREEISRGRTPPPPPKLSEVVGKKRGDRASDNVAPNRSYFDEKRPTSSLEYDFRHKPGYGLPQDELRGSWLNPFPKDPRRVGAGPSTSQSSYPPDARYGGGYQFPASNASGPPRTYYPEFGKTYGSY